MTATFHLPPRGPVARSVVGFTRQLAEFGTEITWNSRGRCWGADWDDSDWPDGGKASRRHRTPDAARHLWTERVNVGRKIRIPIPNGSMEHRICKSSVAWWKTPSERFFGGKFGEFRTATPSVGGWWKYRFFGRKKIGKNVKNERKFTKILWELNWVISNFWWIFGYFWEIFSIF